MEQEIKALKIRVNFLIGLGVLSFALTVLKLLVPALSLQPHAPTPTNTNSVQIGGASKEKPQREYLNTEEAAEREGVSARTILSYIEANRIDPQPTRQGRAWVIAADYRILPQTTEESETAQK